MHAEVKLGVHTEGKLLFVLQEAKLDFREYVILDSQERSKGFYSRTS